MEGILFINLLVLLVVKNFLWLFNFRFIIRLYREVIRSERNLMSNLPDIPKMVNTLSASDATLTETRASRSGE